jgi:hypothetical protein
MSDEPAVATPEAPTETPAESAPAALFHYGTWVHVGPGAEQCSEVDEEKGENRCSDSGHFHAFCRLPNQFQEREIREKAQAAKARRLRQLRTPDSDANEILEQSLEDLLVEADATERLANELVGYDWTGDYLTAVRLTRDLDDESEGAEEGAKLYAHIDEDRRRFAQLQTEDPEQRNEDEFNELRGHVAAYENAVNEQYEAIANPKRESFRAMAESDLVELVRRKRMQFAAQEEFMHAYNVHEWLSCSYKQPKGENCFADADALQRADPAVLDRLGEVFADLERTAQGALGN